MDLRLCGKDEVESQRTQVGSCLGGSSQSMVELGRVSGVGAQVGMDGVAWARALG